MAVESLFPAVGTESIVSQANWSANPPSLADIDSAPDGSWWVASGNNVDTACRVTMPTPTGNPKTGAGLQTTRLYVRQFDSGQSGTPQAQLIVHEAGVGAVATGTATNVTSGTGEWLTVTWDASSLSDATGAIVEVELIVTSTGGNPSNRNTVDLGAVEWIVDYTPAGAGYGNTVSGVASGNIGLVAGVTTASISKIIGVA